MTRLRARTAAALAATTLALGGCGITPFGSDDTTTAAAPDPGRQLTDREAEQALPEVPVGAEAAPVQPEAQDLETSPSQCLDVLRGGQQGDELKATEVVHARRAWSADQPSGSQYTVSIGSHSEPIDSQTLDTAGAAMSTCATFTFSGRDATGTFETTMQSQPRTVAPVGDQTFAARITIVEVIGGQERKIFIDQLVVRVGHNLLRVNHTHWDESSGHEPLEAQVRAMLDDLAR